MHINSYLKPFFIIGLCHLLFQVNSFGQPKWSESKIFEKKQINVIQSRYIDSRGVPSHDQFLKKNGLFPLNQKTELKPYFKVSVSIDDVLGRDQNFNSRKSAKLLNPEFFVETTTTHNSPFVSLPIWDGRVYEDKDSLIVGGYSAKFNERPVGLIDSYGNFAKSLSGPKMKEFSILQIPSEQIIFDPFEWRLLRLDPSNGKTIKNSSKSFLPVAIFDKQGNCIKNIEFNIEQNTANSALILYGIIGDKKVEIAKCNLTNPLIAERVTGYQPALIEGCIQPANGKVITFTLEGQYSENISVNEAGLCLNCNVSESTTGKAPKFNRVKIDGDFSDWQNIVGVSDPEGDYLNYLFKNPDTDLLEFKVTNDEKYLYIYSRVAGAHGRTGKNGRYYWYAYIDVDANPFTGYPPTRDDNCYYGISTGDDAEVQFEFVGNKFVKTFFGFAGAGAEKEALDGSLKLGSSYYSSKAMDGSKRDRYKIEYVNRENTRHITHDNTEGTSKDIVMALSPDGSEVEVRVEMAGFLKDKSGKSIMFRGRKIDIAVGTEGSSDHLGSDKWGADSSPVIYSYKVK